MLLRNMLLVGLLMFAMTTAFAETAPKATPSAKAAAAAAPAKGAPAKAPEKEEYVEAPARTLPREISKGAEGKDGTAFEGKTGPCASDVATYCKDIKRGGGRIAVCLNDKFKKLSADCQAAVQQRRAFVKDFRDSCSTDIDKLCSTAPPGPNSIFKCLRLNMRNLSGACNKEIDSIVKKRKQLKAENPRRVRKGKGAQRDNGDE